MRIPDLATEVTLQPLRRFPVDAAILFSDILVVPEALGIPYHFRDAGGISLERRLNGRQEIDALIPESVESHLEYVVAAIRQIRSELGSSHALVGFSGAPWTLAAYLLEGGSPEPFAESFSLFYRDRSSFDRLLERLTDAVIRYLQLQIAAGVDAIQLFDSWALACPGADYEAFSLKWIRCVVEALRPTGTPVILYARGVGANLEAIATTGAHLSLDASVPLRVAADRLPATTAVQGNLAPGVPTLDPETAVAATATILESMRGRPGFVFNTGHGLTPQTRIETLEAISGTVASWT